MGAAAYQRGNSLISSYFDEMVKRENQNEDAKAQLWKKLLEEGAILTFAGNDGSTITAGPYRYAVGIHPGFALFRYGGDSKWRTDFHGGSWGVALEIIRHVGRKSPYRINLRGVVEERRRR